jgi:hypothetical protein
VQAFQYYIENYPADGANKVLGFLDYNLIFLLELDHIYTSWCVTPPLNLKCHCMPVGRRCSAEAVSRQQESGTGDKNLGLVTHDLPISSPSHDAGRQSFAALLQPALGCHG